MEPLHAMQTYLVGGAIRNRLLGLPVKDRDWVVVGATAEDLLGQGYRRVGRSFPVFIHPQTGEEYTLACRVRGDLSTAGPHVRIEEDLKARDLTVNAIAQDATGELIDPVGGLADLAARRLRPVATGVFAADPLRVLRAARLAAELSGFAFKLDPAARSSIQSLRVKEGLRCLAGERVWQELERALASAEPSRFFQVLRDTDVLADVFPEVDRLFGVPQPPRWHPEIDTGVHTLMVLQQAARLTPRVDARFAALTHDLGKGETPKDILPGHRGHEERGVVLVERLCRRIRTPRGVCDLARITARWHAHVHGAAKLQAKTVIKVLEGTDAFRKPDRFTRFLLACEADFRGRTGFQERAYPQAALFRDAWQAAQAVDTAALAASTTPELAAERVRQARIAAVKALAP
jgi:tRNA nucleotidyltransferase (CCA-adding enzyme)